MDSILSSKKISLSFFFFNYGIFESTRFSIITPAIIFIIFHRFNEKTKSYKIFLFNQVLITKLFHVLLWLLSTPFTEQTKLQHLVISLFLFYQVIFIIILYQFHIIADDLFFSKLLKIISPFRFDCKSNPILWFESTNRFLIGIHIHRKDDPEH